MRSRVVLGLSPHLDSEQLRPVAAVQLLEAVHGDARGAGDKLQKTRSHLIGEGQHHLEDTKEKMVKLGT